MENEKEEVLFDVEKVDFKPTTEPETNNPAFTSEQLKEISNNLGADWSPISLFFLNEKDEDLYFEFLNDVRMFPRLQRICRQSKMDGWKSKLTSKELPLHYKDDETEMVIGHNLVWEKFQEFKIAENFVTGNELGSDLSVIGGVMLSDPQFSEYMTFFVTYNSQEGSTPNWDNVQSELNKAYKRLGI